ncbi:MAG: hypothetical protein HYT12_04440 [Candidatus Liptonbacteria bacterium]|nr:hypothetical protein [Candidatus Liptonbacteria bacterium]
MEKKEKKRHYKNVDFEANLTTASGGLPLTEAAPLWRFSHFGVEMDGDFKHCHLCHSRMKLWIAIWNTANGVVLFIGHDCYDKLVSFLATKKLESLSLGSRKEYVSAIKKYCKQNITESFLAWFGEQEAPAELKATLAFIEKFGYAPTLEAAEALVAYYKTTRRFKLDELLDYTSHRARMLSMLFRDFLADNPLWQEVSLAEYEALDFSFADGLSGEEVGEGFFKEAFRKVLPAGTSATSCFLNGEAMKSWIENARNVKSAVIEEAWKRAVVDLQQRIASQQESYRLLSFWRGRNPKHQTDQWECRDGGRKYVLDSACHYNPSEGPVFCRVTRELVPDRVLLVSKLVLAPSMESPRYMWVTR